MIHENTPGNQNTSYRLMKMNTWITEREGFIPTRNMENKWLTEEV